MNQYTFKYNYVRIAPRKVRLVCDLAKKLSPIEAVDQLKYLPKKAAKPVRELIVSALSSMKDKNVQPEDIKIINIVANSGPSLKRRAPKSRGRATSIKKRYTHIVLTLELKTKKTIKKTVKKDKPENLDKKTSPKKAKKTTKKDK